MLLDPGVDVAKLALVCSLIELRGRCAHVVGLHAESVDSRTARNGILRVGQVAMPDLTDNVLKRGHVFATLESERLIDPLDVIEGDGHLDRFDCRRSYLSLRNGHAALGGLRLPLCAILYRCFEAA